MSRVVRPWAHVYVPDQLPAIFGGRCAEAARGTINKNAVTITPRNINLAPWVRAAVPGLIVRCLLISPLRLVFVSGEM